MTENKSKALAKTSVEEAYPEEQDSKKILSQIEEESYKEAVFEEIKTEPFKVVLFDEDGDYGWIEFAGVFSDLAKVVNSLNKDGKDVIVAEIDEEVAITNPGIDFFLVDVSKEPAEELFAGKKVLENTVL